MTESSMSARNDVEAWIEAKRRDGFGDGEWTLQDAEVLVRNETLLFKKSDLNAVDLWFAVWAVHSALCSPDRVEKALDTFVDGNLNAAFFVLLAGCELGPSFFTDTHKAAADAPAGGDPMSLSSAVFKGTSLPNDPMFTLSGDLAAFWDGICDHVVGRRDTAINACLEHLVPAEVGSREGDCNREGRSDEVTPPEPAKTPSSSGRVSRTTDILTLNVSGDYGSHSTWSSSAGGTPVAYVS